MSAQVMEKLFAAMGRSKGLPALESTVTSILGSLCDGTKGSRDVVAHIVEDFALTQRVLKLVNSSMYAPFARNISSISSALNILGADALQHIVLSTAMVTALELDDDENLSKTLLASELARTVCSDRLEEASIAALMYDLGSLMTQKYLPDEMAVIKRKTGAGLDPDAAAIEILGMTLQQVGAEVAKRWNLPPAIVSVIDGTGDPALIGIAKFSNSASSLIHEGKVEEVNRLVSTLDVPGLDKSKLSVLISRKVEEITPGVGGAEVRGAEAMLDELLVSLSGERKKTVDELAGAIFAGFGESLATAHCLLFVLARSGDYTVRHGYGKGIEELKSKLRISAEFKPTAFHAAINNRVDVSIADVSKLKATALPDGYKALLPNVAKFLILPIANSSVSGLVYCDWETDKEVTRSELVAIRKLRDLFAPFFPR
ncbi:MAG: HDOD domain-containing protein [Rhodocyclales bacterium]|nr:HDOD domain-containing protein [Rhodocyclales bacterium]